MAGVIIAASLSSNRDPKRRVQLFEMLPVGFGSLEEAVEAVRQFHRMNFAPGEDPAFRVYRASDPDGTEYALVEVSAGQGDLAFSGLYKLVARVDEGAGGPG
jgi:hypothetical protein